MKGGTGRRQNKPVDFSISPAIRNPPALRVPPYHNGSDGSRTRSLLWADIDLSDLLGSGGFFGQCSPISDCVCVNSRTPDIGKAGWLLLRISLGARGRLYMYLFNINTNFRSEGSGDEINGLN